MNVIPQTVGTPDFSVRGKVVGLVGTGIMGRGIAQLFASSGFEVLLFDIEEARVRNAIAYASDMIDREAAKGKITTEAAAAAKARLKPVTSLAAFSQATLVIEAIIEDLGAKQELFRSLEQNVSAECVLATNTSSLLVTAIAAKAQHAERICGLHFFNPVPLMKTVEVIGGAKTSPDVISMMTAVVRATGHSAVVAADSPGFLINHAGRGLYTEGLRIVSEGIAPIEDVDIVMREGAGFRMGPFELFDLTGLDVSFKVMTQIYHQFFEEPRYRPQALAARQYSAGLYGRKVGQGFYVYKDGKPVVPQHAAPTQYDRRPIWLDNASNEHADRVRKRLEGLGITLAAGDKPDADSIILVPVVGYDATTVAVTRQFDPERTLAIDPVFGLDGGRITVMSTAVTRRDYRDSLCGILAGAGVSVTTIHDSPGLIAQRMVATIVNIASDIAQQRIASPADIDLGVRLGLGYPAGPLALGDRIGPRVILDILERMYGFYGDPRYRPSPWLKRRALLGRSLTTEEA